MNTDIRFKGRANVVVYENNDVEVRIPQENEGLKLEKLKESKNGTFSRTQGKNPLLQLRVKTAADSPDPVGDLLSETMKLVNDYAKQAGQQLSLPTQKGCKWLSRSKDLKIRADTDNIVMQLKIPMGQEFELKQRLYSKFSEIFSCLVSQRRLLDRLASAKKQTSSK